MFVGLAIVLLLGTLEICLSAQTKNKRALQSSEYRRSDGHVVGIPISLAPSHQQFIQQMQVMQPPPASCRMKDSLHLNVERLRDSKMRIHNRPLAFFRQHQRQIQIAASLTETYKDLIAINGDSSNIPRPKLMSKYEKIRDWEETHSQIIRFHLKLVKHYIEIYKMREDDGKVEAMVTLQRELSALSKDAEEGDIKNEVVGRTGLLPLGAAQKLQRQREIRAMLLEAHREIEASSFINNVMKPTDMDNFPRFKKIRNWDVVIARLAKNHLKFVQQYIRKYRILGNEEKVKEMETLRSELTMLQDEYSPSEDSPPNLLTD